MKRKRPKKGNFSSFINEWKKRRAILKKTDRESGATFMEVLVTMAIIAILMTAIGITVVPFVLKGKVTVAKNDINAFETALTAYYSTSFEYPDESDWKSAIKEFLKKNIVPPDPWGNPYVYVKPGPNDLDYGISSAGPDGIEGNEDDIKSWQDEGE